MALNTAPPPTAGRPAAPVSSTQLLVTVLIVAGLSIAGTAVYFEVVAPLASPASPGSTLVVDDLGRSVSTPTDPHRVVALGPNIVDSMVRLGLRADLVGVDCSSASYGGLLADYTPNQTANWSLDSSMCVEALPSLDTEELLNRTPELILATSIVSESTLDEFSATYHVPVLWLIPTSLSGIVGDIRILAEVYAGNSAAAALESQLDGALASANSALQNLTQSPTASLPAVLLTYYVDPSAGYYTFGPGTFGESLLVLAGARSISANASVPYPVLSGSEVLAANPVVIIYGVGPLGEPLSSYAQAPDWSSLTSDKVALDATLFTEADPTMILVGLAALTNAVHPFAS